VEAQAAARLPTYLRPSVICWVDELPRNANGKTDHPGIRASWLDTQAGAAGAG
jgi:acyl-coenzyme A synthetase/AMP-(fatty) acid ligase